MNAETYYKKVKPSKPRNPVARALKHDGVLRSQTIGDKRSKQLENEAKKREIAFLRMNKKDYDDDS